MLTPRGIEDPWCVSTSAVTSEPAFTAPHLREAPPFLREPCGQSVGSTREGGRGHGKEMGPEIEW